MEKKIMLFPLFTIPSENFINKTKKLNLINSTITSSKSVLENLEKIFNKIEDEDELDVIAFDIGRIQELTKKMKSDPDDIVSLIQTHALVGAISQTIMSTYAVWFNLD
ncbi:MAG: hypothetical protein WC849_01490 [Candidatus Paceibacterota bacterium]